MSGTALWARMQNSFGYLSSGQGYQGHVFPIVIGETGSMYLTVSGVPSQQHSAHPAIFLTPLLQSCSRSHCSPTGRLQPVIASAS